ncbi:hypothetical protein D3C73_705750 [compost metagenome]
MNEKIEEKLYRLASKNIPTPDWESMWQRIEAQTHHSAPSSVRKPPFKKKALTLSAALLCVMVAVPAFADTGTWRWMKSLNRSGITTAIDNGFGQSFEQSIQDQGIAFTLHNGISDVNRVTLNYSFQLPTAAQFDTAYFTETQLTDSSGNKINGQNVNIQDQGSNRLVGYLETNQLPSSKKKMLTLSMKDLHLLKKKQLPLPLQINTENKQNFAELSPELKQLAVTSMIKANNQIVINYTVTLADASQTYTNPSLVLMSEGQALERIGSVTLPPSANPQEVYKQETYQVNNINLSQIQSTLSYMEKTEVIQGNWSVDFELDPVLAKQSVMVKKLNEELQLGSQLVKFKELTISPSQIKVTRETDQQPFDPKKYESVNYKHSNLRIGNQVIEGGFFLDGDKESYKFEAPNVITLAEQPMTLILSNARIQRQAGIDYQITLKQPNETKQTITSVIEGYTVRYTYYKQGHDLIIETDSPNTDFGGIVQTYLTKGKFRTADEQISAGLFNNGVNKQVETYKNIPEGDIDIAPYSYIVIDENQSIEIPLLP